METLRWLWAVIRFIPAVIYIVVAGILFYILVPVPKEQCGRDDHHYLSYFDEY